MASPWKKLNNTPPFSVDTMLLLTDGSVMCHELETANWHKLVPDAKGSYVNGTPRRHKTVPWMRRSTMPPLSSKTAAYS